MLAYFDGERFTWAPDGIRVAFKTRNGQAEGQWLIAVHDLASGRSTLLAEKLSDATGAVDLFEEMQTFVAYHALTPKSDQRRWVSRVKPGRAVIDSAPSGI